MLSHCSICLCLFEYVQEFHFIFHIHCLGAPAGSLLCSFSCVFLRDVFQRGFPEASGHNFGGIGDGLGTVFSCLFDDVGRGSVLRKALFSIVSYIVL